MFAENAPGSDLDPAAQAEQSPLCPSAHGRGIRQTGRVFAVGCGLLGGVAAGDPLAGLLSATQGVVPGRSQPIGQDREGLPAPPTDSAAHPNVFLTVIVSRTERSSAANDRVVPANRTSPRQEVQRDHPGTTIREQAGRAAADAVQVEGQLRHIMNRPMGYAALI